MSARYVYNLTFFHRLHRGKFIRTYSAIMRSVHSFILAELYPTEINIIAIVQNTISYLAQNTFKDFSLIIIKVIKGYNGYHNYCLKGCRWSRQLALRQLSLRLRSLKSSLRTLEHPTLIHAQQFWNDHRYFELLHFIMPP